MMSSSLVRAGVAVDEYGFVYVCGCLSDNVVVL